MKGGGEIPGVGSTGKRAGSGSGVRSESEKEKTKMRERQRRAITTNIFHGLRKHGGYRLTPRADINEVLRQLANEAGWIVLPDGSTYRSPSSILNRCPTCEAARSATPTPTSSVVIGGGDYDVIINDSRAEPRPPFFVSGGAASSCSGAVMDVSSEEVMYGHFQEVRASNQTTPVGSPLLHG